MIESIRDVLIGLSIAMVVVAGFLALARIVRGPTSLDRSVAADVVIAVLIAAVGIHAEVTRLATGLPILVVVSLLGFTAAVGMSRLIASAGQQRARVFPRRRSEDAS